MTFRPSDDVLEEMADGQNPQSGTSQYYAYNNGYNNTYNAGNQMDGQQAFQQNQNFGNEVQGNGNTDPEAVLQALNIPIEEVKAPDLSDLLQNSPNNTTGNQMASDAQVSTTISVDELTTRKVAGITENSSGVKNAAESLEITQEDLDLIMPGKITDVERTSIVLGVEGAVSSNFDFLVDEQWADAVAKYKKLYRVLFKWGMFIFVTVLGLFLGVYAQVSVDKTDNLRMVRYSDIQNSVNWVDNSDKFLSSLVNSGVDIDVLIPYGLAATGVNSFYSSSNLIRYKGIVLPQQASVNYISTDFVSLKDFDNEDITRGDLENMVNYLIKDRNIGVNTRNLVKDSSNEWVPNKFKGGLMEGFSLECVNNYNYRASDFLCDKFLDSFYEYGKYYELSDSQYSSEILSLVKSLREQGKTIEPICNMINEYVLHVGVISDKFDLIMQFCEQEEYEFYRKLVNFIDLEKSLGQPELSDRVYEDPNLNAYKLLSAQQTVYRVVKGTSLNENFIKSYLNYVQALLNKDNKTGRYLAPIYKYLLYVFNTDELYQKILKDGKSELKLQMDQINNGNTLYRYPGLVSQLTIKGIVNPNSELSGGEIDEISIEDIFSQYYSMKDRLKIRSVNKISDNELIVKTELFTNKILSVTDDQTLKLTVTLYRNGNVLYVSNIKITDQPKLSEILNIQVADGNTSFSAVMGIIDEQIGMWYEGPSDEENEEQPTFCEQLQEREDISVYNCDDSSILLYKGDTEYSFALINGVLDSFVISDENINTLISNKLVGVMFMRDNTPTIITSIIDFTVETKDDSLEKKLEIIDQFRIHFKMIPDDINNIEGETEEFLVDFTLGTFKFQAHYNMNTHLLTKISYTTCGKMLEIKPLEIAITTENEDQLTEISNNPQAFFTKVNPAAYKKYQRMCGEKDEEKN